MKVVHKIRPPTFNYTLVKKTFLVVTDYMSVRLQSKWLWVGISLFSFCFLFLNVPFETVNILIEECMRLLIFLPRQPIIHSQ